MRHWALRILVAAAAPLLLTGCLWGPGKFASTLDIRKDGRFTLDYRGEMLLQLPEDKGSALEPWADDKARCFEGVSGDQRAVIVAPGSPPPKERPCTKAEIAAQKVEHDKRAAEKAKENAQMAAMFGLPGQDDESNRRFAANLMKYQGWRSVTYKGKGAFDVDFHFEGRVAQDYAFPLMPDSDLLIPFITVRRRNDGAVKVTAPAFTGGSGPFSARAKMMGLPDKSDGPKSRAEGRFTIITDGEILTNNSEDGPAPHAAGRQIHWDVGATSTKIPEMLVRL
jgi:hypothetical protein